MSEPKKDQRLYQETCRYVERMQEIMGWVPSLDEWERVVNQVYAAMEFLVDGGCRAE